MVYFLYFSGPDPGISRFSGSGSRYFSGFSRFFNIPISIPRIAGFSGFFDLDQIKKSRSRISGIGIRVSGSRKLPSRSQLCVTKFRYNVQVNNFLNRIGQISEIHYGEIRMTHHQPTQRGPFIFKASKRYFS